MDVDLLPIEQQYTRNHAPSRGGQAGVA